MFELRRIKNKPSSFVCPPYFKLTLSGLFQVEKNSFNIQLSTRISPLRYERKKWAMRLTFGNKTNNSEVADCTAPSLTAF